MDGVHGERRHQSDAYTAAAVCEQCTCETCVRARYRMIYGLHDIVRLTNPRSISRYCVIDMITSPHNMVNFGPLAAEIVSLVWGTPGNFNGFRVLAALLHGTLVAGFSQTVVLNRGRHLYSAGRPSRWALAHTSSPT